MKAAIRPLSRLVRDLFRLEPLEPRILLSADPVLGAVALVAGPPQEQAAALLQAYSAQADQVVATQPGDTVLVTQGPARHAQPGWLVVDVSQLASGNGTLVIGGPDSDARILIGEEGGPDVTLGNLVLLNPGAGGEVVMQARLVLSGDLITVGSGHTDIINTDESAASITHIDSMEIGGDRILTATAAAGNIQLGTTPGIKFVNGNGDATPDTLTLRADGNVSIYNTFTGSDLLEGLTIGARTPGGTDLPSSVHVYDTLSLNGDLVIEVESSGIVTFDKLVTINGSGNVHITGANTVTFAGGLNVTGTGNIFIEGNEIDFGTSTESIRGTGVLTLRPSTPGNAIEVGSLGGPTFNTLNLEGTDLAALADGFATIVIGHESSGRAAAGAGAVRIGAAGAPNPLLRDAVEIYGGTVSVEDPLTSQDQMIVNGTIKLDAVGDIVIKGAMIAREASGSGTSDITLWSQSGSVTQVDSLNDNNTASEPIRGALLTVRAATGISLPFTELASVSATNATSGNLSIVEAATGAGINVILLSQANNAANLSLRTTDGSITVNGGISHAGTGLIELDAAGTSKQVTVNQAIASTGGAIKLTATGLVTTSDNGTTTDGTVVTSGAAGIEITSSAGAISQGALVSSEGGEVKLTAATTLTMLAGTTVRSVDAVGNTGVVRLKATGGNVTVANAEADGSIFVTAGSAILGLVSSNPHLDGETAAVLLAAASGIGTSAAGGTLQTRVGTLAASNSGAGGIFVREATALSLSGGATYSLDAAGPISVVTTEGTLTIGQAVRSTGAAGHILLQAGETIEGTTADLAVNAAVGSTSGSTSLAAADNLTIAAGATVSTSGDSTQFVDVRADDSITMDATAALSATGGGAVWVVASAGEVVLGTLDAGTGRAFVSAGTNILDAAGDDATPGVNITGGQVRLAAGGAIGGAGEILETSAVTLAARSSGGDLFLSETDALSIGTVGAVTSSRVAADGTIASAAGVADLAGLDSAGALVLQAGGNLTVPAAVQAAGNLRLHAAGTLDVSAAVASSGGHVSVVATGQMNVNATASVAAQAAGKALDMASTTGHLVMFDGATATTNAGSLRVSAGLTATLSRVDARSDADRAVDSLAGQGGWGDVSIVAGGAILGNASSTDPAVHARQLRLQAGSIASDAVNLSIEAVRLGAETNVFSGNMFLKEATALELGTSAGITVYRVGLDGGSGVTTGQTDAAMAGLSTLTGSTGSIVLQTTAGLLSGGAAATVMAGGNILLRSGGIASDIDLDGQVRSFGGHVSLAAGRHLLLDGDITASGSGKSIDLLATGAVTLAQGHRVSTADGNVSVDAGGTVTLEEVDAGTGSVRISGSAIIDGDAAGDSEVDVKAVGLVLSATAGGIGAAGAQLETQVADITGNAIGGGVYLHEADGATVRSLQVNVSRVGSNAGQAATTHAAQEGLRGDAVVLTSTGGNVVVQAGTSGSPGVVGTAGPVRIEAGGGLQVEASVDAGAGSLSLIGGGLVTLGLVDAIVLSGGSVDLESTGAALNLASGTAVQSSGGAIRVHALGDLQVSVLDARTLADRTVDSLAGQAGWGSVSVLAGGAINDYAGDTAANIYAKELRLESGGGIGAGNESIETEAAVLSAKAGAGGMYLDERTALVVGETAAISVARPDADGVAPGTPGSVADGVQSGIDSGGVAVLVAGGALETTHTVQAAGNLLLASGTGASLTVGALVRSTGGHLDLTAGGTLALNANAETQANAATLVLDAGGDITQAQATRVSTNNGNLAVVAGGVLTVEEMTAATAALHAQALSIVDGDAAGDTEIDFTAAGSLRLLGTNGVGESGDSIETDTGLIAARSTTGAVFIRENDAVSVGTMGATLVQRVQAGGGIVGENRIGDSGLAGTNVVLVAGAGSVTLSAGGSVAAAGNLLLQANGAGSDLAIQSGVTVSATGGSMSLLAIDEIVLGGTVSVLGSGTLDMRATRVDLQQNSLVSTGGGDVALVATGNVVVEKIDAGGGGVRIAGNRVDDGDATNDSEVDIIAGSLAITAGERIGLSANALETSVGTASLRATSNVFVTETDALTLDTVSVAVNHVGTGGAAVLQAAVGQSDNTGTIVVLRTVEGSLDSTAAGGAVTATGNLLLEAGGAAADLTTRAAVTSTGGSISLKAGHRLEVNANIGTAAGSIDLLAGENLVQAQGTSIASTGNGHVSLEATTGSVTIEHVSTGAGRLQVAGTSIIDGDAAGDAEIDLLANGILFTATNGSVGSSGNAIETTTSTISAVAQQGGSVYVTETDALDVGSVSFSVNQVNSSGAATAHGNSQNGVSGTTVVVRALGGTLDVKNAVEASGNLLLEAGGAGNLIVGAQVRSTGGALSLVAGGAMTLNANVLGSYAHADGTVDLRSAGAFTQAQGTTVSTAGGNLAVQAGGAATIEKLDAGSGKLRLVATGVIDGDAALSDDVDLIADTVKLEGANGIGATGAALEITAGTLAAKAAAGAIFLSESNALTVGSVAVDVRNVSADGSAPVQAVTDTALVGLQGQNVVLQTLNGLLAIDTAGSVVATGNLLLTAGGTDSDLTVAASVSAAGAMSLSANRNVSISSTLSTTGGTTSTIDVVATSGSLTAVEGSAISAVNANVLLQANGNLTIDSVSAGTGAIRLQGADIVDGDSGASETEVDVIGAQLQVTATGAVGATTNALETTIATLSISAGGSITLAESDALAIDATSVTVNRVGASGAITATTAVTQSDVTSTGGSIALTAQGAIDLPANADVRTSGAATITLTSTTGAVLMQAASPGQSIIETGSGDIRINAEGDIRPGALITTGHAYTDSANGRILIAGDLQRNGDDINLVGDDLVISVPVSSPGAVLTIGPLTTGTTVVVGNVAPGGVLQVDTTELDLLQDGFAQIVIGSALDNQSVQLEGNGLGNALVFTDPLVLLASGNGGTISLSGTVNGDTLLVQDAGVSTTLTGATVQMQGNLTVQDQVLVNGASTLTAGAGGAGALQFTQAISGVAGGAADILALSASGGNVQIDEVVSDLDGLTITDAADVTFGNAVTVNGDLVIEATGTVTFNSLLTLGNNGRLVVRGGGQVVFAAGANLGTGDATLEVSGLQANGGAGSIVGQGTLAISGATTGMAIHLGSGAGAGLVIGETALAALGAGFDAIQFGSGVGAGAGAVTLGTADLRATDAAITVLGSSIAVNAGGAGLQVDTHLTLRSDGAVTTTGRIVSSAPADVALTSNAGAVTMTAGASIVSAGGRIDLAAAGALAVASLDARAGGGGAGSVNLRSTSGVIVDANADTAVDVYAQAVDFIGAGPAAGDVLEVAAPIVRVEPGAGLLLRESGADGRTYYNVLRGGAVQQALVAVGPSVRVTSDPDNFVGDAGLLQDMGLALPLAPSAFQASQLSATFQGGAAGSLAAGSGADAGDTQVGSYLSGGASMVAPELSLTHQLLADSGLGFASGQPVDSDSGVDWWLESVEL